MPQYYQQVSFTIEAGEAGIAFLSQQLNESAARCDYAIEGEEIHIYAEESVNLDALAKVVQEYLIRFAPRQYVTIEWANTCSKNEAGAFGGGAVLVMPDRCVWFNSGDLSPSRLPALAAHILGVDAKLLSRLDEVVSHATAGLPEVDNEADLQLRTLLETFQT